MDQAFINEMKTRLEAEKQELEKQLGTISAPDSGEHVIGDRAATFPDYGDDALGDNTASPAEVADYATNVEITRTLEGRLEAVNAALERISSGTYGVTADGELLSKERLQADPTATVNISAE